MAEQPQAAADTVELKPYDEFAAGIDTYRLPNVSLEDRKLGLSFDDGSHFAMTFTADRVLWTATGAIDSGGQQEDPYDAVQVRKGVYFLNLPLESRDGEAVTFAWSENTGRAIIVHSVVEPKKIEGRPQVQQHYHAATLDGHEAVGNAPGPSRDLIGLHNIYRYSPNHLYEHIYMSSTHYAWQNLQGVQRGNGGMDPTTTWKLEDGLYMFSFRELTLSVSSVWLHDIGYNLMTTGIFLGINSKGQPEHARGGGHIYPLGSVRYPDVKPV